MSHSQCKLEIFLHKELCETYEWILPGDIRGLLDGSAADAQSSKLDTKDVLAAIHLLGVLYADQGKLAEAEKMYVRALQGYAEAIGAELVKTYIPALNTMRNLGDLYSETRLDEARAVYAKALSGYAIVHGVSSDICLYLKHRMDTLNVPR